MSFKVFKWYIKNTSQSIMFDNHITEHTVEIRTIFLKQNRKNKNRRVTGEKCPKAPGRSWTRHRSLSFNAPGHLHFLSLGFHPNVTQILTEFSEYLQKKMQIYFHPLPLCKYVEFHWDYQLVELILQSLLLNHGRRRGHSKMTSLKELQSKLKRWKTMWKTWRKHDISVHVSMWGRLQPPHRSTQTWCFQLFSLSHMYVIYLPSPFPFGVCWSTNFYTSDKRKHFLCDILSFPPFPLFFLNAQIKNAHKNRWMETTTYGVGYSDYGWCTSAVLTLDFCHSLNVSPLSLSLSLQNEVHFILIQRLI